VPSDKTLPFFDTAFLCTNHQEDGDLGDRSRRVDLVKKSCKIVQAFRHVWALSVGIFSKDLFYKYASGYALISQSIFAFTLTISKYEPQHQWIPHTI